MFCPHFFCCPPMGGAVPNRCHPMWARMISYFNLAWTPDGQQIYATHYHHGSDENDPDDTRIVKISLDGKVTSVLNHATWPEISRIARKWPF